MNYKQAAEQLREYSQIFYEERKRRGCLTYKELIVEAQNKLIASVYKALHAGGYTNGGHMDGLFKKLSQKVDN